ncbi:MAG: bifunctional folylpolyglutamate synthase/dihydrofolate synthase [Mariprofundales bacterium]|nr:bifunctional folylpolyglutamate synthase/dihydrofolate synthase [Mariprofundales bacterium]
MLLALGAPAADRDYRPGHARMHALLNGCVGAGFSLRRPRLRIRVAGTNGKGSTAAMVAAGLMAAGARVALYSSPHIQRFGERIRIDGAALNDAALRAYLTQLLPMAKAVGASYFELATTLALVAFSQAEVDVEVLEAGVGARFDATTAVAADMALLTPIALDHQAWLGDTLAAIAEEKAYVGVGCRWCLTVEQPEAANDALARFGFQEPVVVDDALQPAMAGAHQQQNASLALRALDLLYRNDEMAGDWATIGAATLAAQLDGRLACYRLAGTTVWLDAAHNAHGVAAVVDWVRERMDVVLIYTREDRSLAESLPQLRRIADTVIGQSGDGLDHHLPTVCDGLAWAQCHAPGGRWLVLGSFLTVAAAQNWLMAHGASLFDGKNHGGGDCE